MDARVEKILKLPGYQRALLLLVLLLVIAGLFAYLVYLPQRAELGRLHSQRSSLENRLSQERDIAGNLPKFRAQYKNLQHEFQLALTQLPDKKEIPALLTSISDLARENGLDVKRFKPSQEHRRGFYAEVPVQLKLVGSYQNVALFCQAVGNLARIVNISNLAMTNPKNRNGQTQLSVTCLATTFRFIEPGKGKRR